MAVAEADTAGGAPIVVVSLYGLIDNGYAYTTLHKQISDLTALLDSSAGRRVILGGDFNAGTQGSPRWRRLYENLWERMELLGLVDLLAIARESRGPLPNCPCDLGDRCGHVHTVKLRGGKPVQADYLFATRELAELLISCRVIDGGAGCVDPFSISDHRPILAEFDLQRMAQFTMAPPVEVDRAITKPPAPRPAPESRGSERARDSRLTQLTDLAEALAAADADANESRITDVRLLVHTANGRVSSNWQFLRTSDGLRRRSFSRPLVWASAWLAIDTGQVTPRHGLVRAALEYCEIETIDGGVDVYADRAVSACRARLRTHN